MGCLAPLAILAFPRLVMIFFWIFTDYLSRVYDGWVIPLLGFFLLPTTTMAYAIADIEAGGLDGWGLILVIVALFLDLGLWGGGRGIFNRR